MTCEQCQDHMTFFLTHQLSRAEEEEFRSHVNICEACRRELDEVEHFARAVHNVSVPFRQSTALIENRMREPIELGFWGVAIMVNAGAAMVYSARTIDAYNAKTE